MISTNNVVFRNDINALRAFAVLGVLFFHFKAGYVQGGFAGVDVFFVISGYLMSAIILKGIEQGNFSVKAFYTRRLKRIAPALIAVVAAITIICYWLYFPTDYREMQKNALSSLLFVSNFYYLTQTGYFASSADANIFLHTWSLSVEWQFYLVYPFILIGFSKLFKTKAALTWGLGATVIVLYGASVLATRYYGRASFFLLPTRCWEMMAGGIALLGQGYFKRPKVNQFIALAGYVVLVGCMVLLNTKVAWPGKYTWLPVTATVFILCANVNWRILQIWPVQFFGKISYSLYLWHWPVYVISQYVGMPLNVFSITAMVAVSTLLAALSYRYIETVNYRSSSKILVTAGGATIIVLVLAVTTTNAWIFNQRALRMLTFADNESDNARELSLNPCFECLIAGTPTYNKERCMRIDSSKKNVLLIGDSHAAHLSATFAAFFSERNINLLQATATHCLPVITPNGDARGYKVINYAYHQFLSKNAPQIDGIIISAAWYNNNYQETAKTLHQLRETLIYLNKLNKKVVVLGQSEAYNIPYPTIRGREIQYNVNLRHRYLNTNAEKVNNAFKAALPDSYIDLYDINEKGMVAENGTPYMFDTNHYSRYGADLTLSNLMQIDGFKNFLQAL